MKRIATAILFLLLLLTSAGVVVAADEQEFFDDILKLRDLTSLSIEATEGIGIVWDSQYNRRREDDSLILCGKQYIAADYLINMQLRFDLATAKRDIKVTFLPKSGREHLDWGKLNKVIFTKINLLLGKPQKTLDRGFLKKRQYLSYQSINRDFVIKAMRYRLHQTTLVYASVGGEGSVGVAGLMIMPFLPQEDLQNLIPCNIDLELVRAGRPLPELLRNPRMLKFTWYIDPNDGVLLDEYMQILGKIEEDTEEHLLIVSFDEDEIYDFDKLSETCVFTKIYEEDEPEEDSYYASGKFKIKAIR